MKLRTMIVDRLMLKMCVESSLEWVHSASYLVFRLFFLENLKENIHMLRNLYDPLEKLQLLNRIVT